MMTTATTTADAAPRESDRADRSASEHVLGCRICGLVATCHHRRGHTPRASGDDEHHVTQAPTAEE